eukprot:GSMAST32.ASY1.ANO1.948.1 assembled CDS
MSLHASLHHPVSREWMEPHLHPSSLVYPIFVTSDEKDVSIPGFSPNMRWGRGADGTYSGLISHLEPL